MLVYRLEIENGHGPYSTEETFSLLAGHRCLETYPTIFSDLINMEMKWNFNVFCGFDSFDKLLQWFGKELPGLCQLKNNSIYLTIYEIDSQYVYNTYSNKQVGFYKEKGELVRKVLLKDYPSQLRDVVSLTMQAA